jgi:hypothetical protein
MSSRLLATVFAAVSLAVEGSLESSARRLTQHASLRRAKVKRELPATCSCDCCQVSARRSDEKTKQTGVKCAVAETSTHCDTQCLPRSHDTILGLFAQDQVLDTTRFCFYECKPAAGRSAPVESACLSLEEQEASYLLDKDGNLMDPAALYEPGYALLAKKATPADVEKGLDAINSALNATEEHLEKLRHSEEQTRVPGVIDVTDPLAVAADVTEKAKATEEIARSSAREADLALQALKIGRRANWRSAMFVANRQIRGLHRKEMQEHGPTPTPWRDLASKAARDASRPYLQVARSARNAEMENRQVAADLRVQHNKLTKKASDLKSKADLHEKDGKTFEAQQMREVAKELEDKAGELHHQSQKSLEKADEIRDTVDKYFQEATKVSVEAGLSAKVSERAQYAKKLDPLDFWVPTAKHPLATFNSTYVQEETASSPAAADAAPVSSQTAAA